MIMGADKQNPEEESELVGAIINGLERGGTLQEIGKTLLNAGYKPEDVNKALEKVPKDIGPNTLSQPIKKEILEKPKSSKLKIILIVVALLFIVGVLIFIFRDFLMGLIK